MTQSSHSEAPSLAVYLPGVHAEQALDAVPPAMLAKEPAVHGTQLVAPTDTCHLPASHTLHVLMPNCEYLPWAPGVQVVAAPPVVASGPDAYLPGSQALQADAATDEAVEGVHEVHMPPLVP